MSEINSNLIKEISGCINTLYNIKDEGIVSIEIPKDLSHGDFSTNIAMRLTKVLHKNPQVIAKEIVEFLSKVSFIEKIEVAGPGFINIFVKKNSMTHIIKDVIDAKDTYGQNNFGNKEKIMVEYVSANPTGDLHLGHARGAAYGDSLTRVLKFSGYDCLREYYVNDAGNQIEVLAESLYQRYREALGESFDLKKIGYQGKDVIKLAKDIAKDIKKKYLDDDTDERKDYFRKIGTDLELSKIKVDLDLYRVGFDHYQSELDLYKSGKVKNVLEELKKSGKTYELDGALWLKTTDFGDDKDRVLVKSDGSLTYLTPDLAYHKDKFDRGYTKLIDLFGADHHGYIARLKAGLKILGYNPDNLEIEIIQIVRLMENGEEVKMSKRTGNAVTIRELCDDVGVDVARYFFISKPIVSHLDFDLNLARKHSNENPIYYIQYAFARTCSILKKDNKFDLKDEYNLLTNEKEISLLKQISMFKDCLSDVCNNREVNILSNYLYKLAQLFHSYYNDSVIIDKENEALSKERLALIKAVNIVLKNGLNLLGVNAPENM